MFKGFSGISAEDYITIDRSNIVRKNNNFKRGCKRFSPHEAKQFFFSRVVKV